MRILLLVVFGAAGTLARYGLEGWIQHRAGSGFPFGTLAVNLSGCLLLGLVGQFALNHIGVSPELRSGVTIGFLGAFTTFSTFTWESVHMLRDGEWKLATSYIVVSALGGLAAMLAGMRLGDVL